MTKKDWVMLGLSVLTVGVTATATVIVVKKLKKIPVFPLWDFKKTKGEETNNNK